MPQNGYWIECVPIGTSDTNKDLYHAVIASIPEAKVTATSPDMAIQELRDKLLALRHDYCVQGRMLPEHDNPVRPPRNSKSTKGWISIYVKMTECCHNQGKS